MIPKRIQYHMPSLGVVSTVLRDESARLYDIFETKDEIGRLKTLDHLGMMRLAWEGAHHPRWEYVVLIMSLVDRCKPLDEIHLSSRVSFQTTGVSSGYELLKCWALLLNMGHLVWTFEAERALMFETWADRRGARHEFLTAFPSLEMKNLAAETLKRALVHRFFQFLAYIRLPHFIDKPEERIPWEEILWAYISPEPTNERLAALRNLFRNVRRIAYLSLDCHYTPSVVNLNLGQVLSDQAALTRLLLQAPDSDGDELAGLDDYLNREIYLGRPVMEAMAAREAGLRREIRSALRTASFRDTLEELAAGRPQQRIQPEALRTIVRLPVWGTGPLSDLVLDPINPRVAQEHLEKALREHGSVARALIWTAPGRNGWVLQSHASIASSTRGAVSAYLTGWSEVVSLHERLFKRWGGLIPDTNSFLQEVLFGRLASELALSGLALFFGEPKRWEWQPAASASSALIGTRRSLRAIVDRLARNDKLPAPRRDELFMLGRSLRRRPAAYAVAAGASVIAYAGGTHIAEVDGLFLETAPTSVALTLIEVKRQRSGAVTAARRALEEKLDRLNILDGISTGRLQSEAVTGTWARAWKTLIAEL